jgi:AcrR family transcriptional regulator
MIENNGLEFRLEGQALADGATKQGKYHHGDLRRALIDAALQLIAEQGVSGLTLREVAQRVGVSRMAPYRHFEDKSTLLAAVAQEGFRALRTYLNSASDRADPKPLERLQGIGVAYVRYAVANPAHYRVMFGSFFGDQQTYPELYGEATDCFGVLVQTVVECQQLGCIRSGEPKEVAQVLWSLVHGLSMLLIDGQLPAMGCAPVEDLAIAATRTIIDGLKS